MNLESTLKKIAEAKKKELEAAYKKGAYKLARKDAHAPNDAHASKDTDNRNDAGSTEAATVVKNKEQPKNKKKPVKKTEIHHEKPKTVKTPATALNAVKSSKVRQQVATPSPSPKPTVIKTRVQKPKKPVAKKRRENHINIERPKVSPTPTPIIKKTDTTPKKAVRRPRRKIKRKLR